jgi:nucleoid-associated protein YgaU
MALSVKVALLTSLGFILGMSWLVSEVARPIVELPTPLVVRGPAGGSDSGEAFAAAREPDRDRGGRASIGAGRFERSSALQTPAKRYQPEGVTLVVAEPPPSASVSAEPDLPPLYVPDAPVVALVAAAAPEPPISVGAAGSVMTMTPVPEAIIASVPSVGTRLLAALRPGPKTAEIVDAVADPEPAAGVLRQYRVKPGDSLVKIMRREWNRSDEETLQVLLAANPAVAKRRDRIYAGELLIIPDRGSARATSPAVAVGSTGQFAAGRSGVARDDSWYTIRERDSLASIARRHLNDAERWPEIAKLNRLRNANKILPGMRIKLPPIRMDT